MHSKLTVTYALRVSVELDKVVKLQPDDHLTFGYWFKVRCTRCHAVSSSEVCLRMDATYSAWGDYVHLNRQCRACQYQGTIEMVPAHGTTIQREASKDIVLMKFKCHGLMPMDFMFNRGWTATLADGEEVPNLDLSSGKYIHFNAQGETAFSILALDHTFEVED